MRAVMAWGLLAVVMSAHSAPAAIYEGPWCAIVPNGEDSYSERCDMRSFEMCRAEIQGTGGSCNVNPYFRGVAQEPRRVRRQRSREQ